MGSGDARPPWESVKHVFEDGSCACFPVPGCVLSTALGVTACLPDYPPAGALGAVCVMTSSVGEAAFLQGVPCKVCLKK